MLRILLLASAAPLIAAAPAAAQSCRQRGDLRPRRPQHRLGHHVGPHRRRRRPPGKGRQGHPARRLGFGRRVEVGGRRHDLQAGVRQAAGAVDRRGRARPDQPATSCGSAPAKAGPATRSRSATASTSRPTAARPGPTSACPRPSGSPASSSIRRTAISSMSARPGALWSDSPDRGLYKTTDGGRTWSLILKGANLSTGCSSVAMDPANPEHLLAGTWDFRRKPYEFRSGGNGPDAPSGSRFAESRDGGRTWTDLNASNRKGLPQAAVGPARDRLSRRPTRSASMRSSRMSARRCSCRTTAAAAGRSATAARAWSGGPSISAGSSSTRRTRTGCSRWAIR